MRLRVTLFAGLIAASALALGSVGAAAPFPMVNGGGQTDVGTSGAGDTIAFTAQELPGRGVTGQIQYIDREGGTGEGQILYHGTVECLEIEGNVANFAGTWNDGGEFEVFAEDNGSGDGTDVIAMAEEAVDPECGDDDDSDAEESALARGNVTVHN